MDYKNALYLSTNIDKCHIDYINWLVWLHVYYLKKQQQKNTVYVSVAVSSDSSEKHINIFYEFVSAEFQKPPANSNNRSRHSLGDMFVYMFAALLRSGSVFQSVIKKWHC